MADIASIGTFLATLKNAADIAKAIKEADISLAKAEHKYKIAELIESLADARMQAAEIQESLRERDVRIKELEEAWNMRDKLMRHVEAYYEVDNAGNPYGDPYCSFCWENDGKAIHLHHSPETPAKACPRCKTPFKRNYVPTIRQDQPETAGAETGTI